MTKPLTGRKVFAMFVAFFGLIIAVNVTMAYNAIKTFPGVEEAHPYNASQTFDADREAQERLGWSVRPAYDGTSLIIDIRDRDGNPASVADLTVLVGRKTMAAEDQTPDMTPLGGLFTAPVALAPGDWLLHINAKSTDGTVFRQRLDFFVDG
ncbi:nitrogen fixation protein FixH [Rhodobacter aestuarii]|uniref:Nitrogen fixation protein FixH n=1 Tax=Rhodobacter aestuarii TaxID=453582 RepID=A0A1N7PM56_9RHOB|nr:MULTISPECIES: FixH family protein [Rhodobacter]PTV94308.1 nitrogen fixation protein FixH [Rhodobacter aestuarii]SIT11600.1 Nitrogen fixation protein FixH [Rhodobacter aestuarii]SOC04075.1 nitrogen fixation protein FixH [Rhodobacter sp. JA431]